jgi:hypothetical protein
VRETLKERVLSVLAQLSGRRHGQGGQNGRGSHPAVAYGYWNDDIVSASINHSAQPGPPMDLLRRNHSKG